MIHPDVEVEASTDAEIIAAYLEQGLSEETARAYFAVLRNPDPEMPVE